MSKIKDLIRPLTKNLDDYNEKYMKTKFDSDDNLTLSKKIEILIITIVGISAFHENNKYYPHTF